MCCRTYHPAIFFLALLVTPVGALAQWRCDCTTIVARCEAQVTARERWIDVTTDNRQCARVDYFVDGLPFVTTVVEGQSRLDWLSPRANPDIRVQSCQVCADNAAAATPAVGGADQAQNEGSLEPQIRWSAAYPAEAQLHGIEGHATVEFDVTAQGTVENAVVVESEPDEVFDAAALDAVRRWRYRAEPERPATHLSERIDFSLGEMILQLQPATAQAPSDAAASSPRNRCIREDAVYNFGEMVEADLINACEDPLLVFGCAEGTGRQAGRWVCTDSERLQTILVRPDDERIGATWQRGRDADGIERLVYEDSFVVARAPNSQYWWVACMPTDDGCRQDARMWIRSMDRQPANVNPRARASITVAGSY